MQHSFSTTLSNTSVEHRVFLCSFLVALLLHAVFAFALLDFFKPKSFVVNLTTHRVSLSTQRIEPSSTSSVNASVPEHQPVHAGGLASKSESLDSPSKKPSVVQEKSSSSSNVIDQRGAESVKVERSEAPVLPPEKASTSLVVSEPKALESADNEVLVTQSAEARPIGAPVSLPPAHQPKNESKDLSNDELITETGKKADLVSDQQIVGAKVVKAELELASSSEDAEPTTRQLDYQLGSQHNPEPEYPRRAIKRGWEGDVVLGVHVDVDGNVTYVEILESSHIGILDYAAHSTVAESWTFSPADESERELTTSI